MSIRDTPIKVEYTVCNLCGSDKSHIYYQGVDKRYRHTPKDIFQLVKCNECGLIYLNPRPMEDYIVEFYPPSFYNWRAKKAVKQVSFVKSVIRRVEISNWRNQKALSEKVAIVCRNRPEAGKLLDVGSAEGEFVAKMKDLGWTIEGVEISDKMCNYVRERYGIKCHNSSINSLELPQDYFDVVTFWSSLEHLYDPNGAVKFCHGILKKDGIIVILVPNSGSLEEKLLRGIDPNPIDIPRHLYHFGVESLTKMLGNNGFVSRHVKYFTFSAADRMAVISNGYINQWIPPRNAICKIVRLICFDASIIVGDLIAGILSRFGRSHSLIVVAQKI